MKDRSPSCRGSSVGRLNLVCFPYAGGSSAIFNNWARYMGERYNIFPVSLPGRGSRIRERPFENWADLLDDVLKQLEPILPEPFVLFGHSFGGRAAYETMQRLGSSTNAKAFIVSGCRIPSYRQNRPLMHLLSDRDFKHAIKTMKGTPQAILENDDFMKLMLPTVRADMMLSETWHEFHDAKISTPLHVILGRDDAIESRASVAGWGVCTSAGFSHHDVPGGHFNLDDDTRGYTQVIEKILEVSHATH